MVDFWNTLTDPDFGFLRLALLVGVFSSFTFGIVGTFVVVRRISYLAGAISHCVFGGIGAGLYLRHAVGWSWFDPVFGATLAALAAAVIIGLVSLYGRQREDSVISAIWAVGMAAGLLLIDRVPGSFDIASYLFGDILLISETDVYLVVVLGLLVVASVSLFYNKLVAICCDEEFSRLRGVNTAFYYLFLLCITALSVVLLVRVVGVVMVIALLTLPPAAASRFSTELRQMMFLSIALCILFVVGGLALSYIYGLSSGPTIILVAGAVYLGVVVFKRKS